MMGLDYYAILDIKRDASIYDLKLAYRKLALQLHPLRKQYQQHPNPKEEGTFDLHLPKLKEGVFWELVNEAYDVLSNDLWRQTFDLYGEEGLKRGVAAPNGFLPPYVYHKDYMRTYFEFFGSYSPYSDLIDACTNPPPLYKVKQGIGVIHQDPEIIHNLHLTLEDIYNGAIKSFKYVRREFVDEWKMITTEREITLTIPIPAGCIKKTRIVYAEHGDQSITRKSADIVFVTCEEKHPIFRRDGNDLHMRHTISLKDALLGFILPLKTLDNRKFEVYITDIVHCNYEKHLENEGLIDLKNPHCRGDLIIHFDIKFPKYISQHLRVKLADVCTEIEEYENNYNEEKLCAQDCD